MLSVSIHALRRRLLEANARSAGLLRQEQELNAGRARAHDVVRSACYHGGGHSSGGAYRLPQGRRDRAGDLLSRRGRHRDHRRPVRQVGNEGRAELAPRRAPSTAPGGRHDATGRGACSIPRPSDRPSDAALDSTGVTHGAWVPVCPDGSLHGVLGIATRGAPIPKECIDRCVALGHFLELALSNWAAHEKLKEQATIEERRRIARELHDGLAHELAFIASKTRGWTGTVR